MVVTFGNLGPGHKTEVCRPNHSIMNRMPMSETYKTRYNIYRSLSKRTSIVELTFLGHDDIPCPTVVQDCPDFIDALTSSSLLETSSPYAASTSSEVAFTS